MGIQSTLEREAGVARHQMSTALAMIDVWKSYGTNNGQSVPILCGASGPSGIRLPVAQPDGGADARKTLALPDRLDPAHQPDSGKST